MDKNIRFTGHMDFFNDLEGDKNVRKGYQESEKIDIFSSFGNFCICERKKSEIFEKFPDIFGCKLSILYLFETR